MSMPMSQRVACADGPPRRTRARVRTLIATCAATATIEGPASGCTKNGKRYF